MHAAASDQASAHRWLILAICCMSLLIVGMDATIVNVALPSIQRDLDASVSELQWIVAGYTVVLASLLMLGGSTGDRLGRARVFQTGLALFTLASLACSLAPSGGWLVVFRALQGIGASMLNPVAMSIIRNTFHDPRERAQAIGVWAAMLGVSLALGPVLGGILVDVSWRAVFLINIPVGLAAIALTARFVPESRASHARRLDPLGQLLVIALLASTTSAFIEAPNLGWGSPWVIALFAVAVASLATLIPYELRRREPLIEPRFFRSRPFAASSLTAISAFAAFSGFLFVNTLYLQEVRGLSAATAGVCTLPIAVMTMICAPIAGRIVGRRGVRIPLVIGGTGIATGSLMLLALADDTPIGFLLAAYFIFGIGIGSINAPVTASLVAGMPPGQAGVAAAVGTSSRMVGQTLGIAVIGTVATAGVTSSLHDQLVASSHPAWWATGGLGIAIVGLGLFASTAAALQSAERTAARLDPEAAAA